MWSSGVVVLNINIKYYNNVWSSDYFLIVIFGVYYCWARILQWKIRKFQSSMNNLELHYRILGHLSSVFCVAFDKSGSYVITVIFSMCGILFFNLFVWWIVWERNLNLFFIISRHISVNFFKAKSTYLYEFYTHYTYYKNSMYNCTEGYMDHNFFV